MTVKDILGLLADCPPEAAVSIAITDGLRTEILPAQSTQLLVNKVDNHKVCNLVVIHNKNEKA